MNGIVPKWGGDDDGSRAHHGQLAPPLACAAGISTRTAAGDRLDSSTRDGARAGSLSSARDGTRAALDSRTARGLLPSGIFFRPRRAYITSMAILLTAHNARHVSQALTYWHALR